MIEETFLNLLEGDRTQLPENWRWSRLVDVCDVFMGQSPPSSTYNEEGQGLPFFQGKADFGEVYPSIRKWCAQPQRIAQSGDILMSVRAPVGPTNIANTDCCIGRGLSAIRPGNEISLWFLFRYLQHIGSQIADLGQGSTFTAISRKEVENLYVPVPPLDEQRRIVAKLESILAQLRTARAALHCIPPTLKALRQSVLAAAFRGELTGRDPNDEPASLLLERIRAERRQRWQESLRARGKDPAQAVYAEPSAPDATHLPELPEGWVWTSFDSLLLELKNGYFSKAPVADPQGIPILRISAVRPFSVNLADRKYLLNMEENLSGYTLQEHDLLFTRYNGTLELVGVCGMIRGLSEDIVYPDKLIRARVVTGILPEYLELYFASQGPRKIIEEKAKSSAGQTGVSGKDLKTLPVILPPARDQQTIVEKINKIIHTQNIIMESRDIVFHRLDELEQSALAKAFRGELV